LTQVPKNHFALATVFLCHWSFEITLKLYLYGKYSIQIMIFWSLCVFIWFKNIEKMLLQMTTGFLQLEATISIYFDPNKICLAYTSTITGKKSGTSTSFLTFNLK
jgi:hypothetical protein